MAWDVYAREVRSALLRGTTHLVRCQSRDGFWREYQLPPGASEAWTTSWIGCALVPLRHAPGIAGAAARAGIAVRDAVRSGGWGYNRSTEPDADSTAWSLRFLSILGRSDARAATACLDRYLDSSGNAHTFVGNAGAWGSPHADVTPVVGLALISNSAPAEIVWRVRGSVLAARGSAGVWRSFWWSAETYATTWSVEFLAASGGLPRAVAADAAGWLDAFGAPANGFESAHRLLLANQLGLAGTQIGARFVDELLALRTPSGEWEPSPALLVPARTMDSSSPSPGAHRDRRALMTTAAACSALAGWLATTTASLQRSAA